MSKGGESFQQEMVKKLANITQIRDMKNSVLDLNSEVVKQQMVSNMSKDDNTDAQIIRVKKETASLENKISQLQLTIDDMKKRKNSFTKIILDFEQQERELKLEIEKLQKDNHKEVDKIS